MKKKLNNFLKGMGSIFDIAPRTKPYRPKPPVNDAEAIRKDWEAVGKDMKKVICKHKK